MAQVQKKQRGTLPTGLEVVGDPATISKPTP